MDRKNKHVVVDVEANGPIVGTHSCISFGAVIVEPGLKRTFYGKLKPISNIFVPEALAVSGFTHEQTLEFDNPEEVMKAYAEWLKENIDGKPIFWSDNLAFDWQWINWYYLTFHGSNPFGFSGRRIGDVYSGMKMNPRAASDWKRLFRKTKHDHNPVNDAKGNAEALIEFDKMGFKLF